MPQRFTKAHRSEMIKLGCGGFVRESHRKYMSFTTRVWFISLHEQKGGFGHFW